MNKELKFMLFLLVVLLCVLSIMIILVFKMTGDETECVREPFKYVAEKSGAEPDRI